MESKHKIGDIICLNSFDEHRVVGIILVSNELVYALSCKRTEGLREEEPSFLRGLTYYWIERINPLVLNHSNIIWLSEKTVMMFDYEISDTTKIENKIRAEIGL